MPTPPAYTRLSLLFCTLPVVALMGGWVSTGPDGAAKVVVESELRADNPPPVGVNEMGNAGGTEYSAGNLIRGAGFEPGYVRVRHRVSACGTDASGHQWAETEDGGGMTNWELVTTGYLDGADFRIYRLEDASGNALPIETGNADDYVQLDNAAKYELVGSGTLPVVSADFPFGGWDCESYARTSVCTGTRVNLSFTDSRFVDNGTKYYYIVTAIGDGKTDYGATNETAFADCTEVSATPLASLSSSPRISFAHLHDLESLSISSGGWYEYHFDVAGATGTVTWSLLDKDGNAVTSLAGLTFDTSTGVLYGGATSTPAQTRFKVRVTAGNGSDTREFLVNDAGWTATSATTPPTAPKNVTATAGNGCVRLTWSASTSTGVVGYRVYRCRKPLADQAQRVHFPAGTPALHVGDYLHLDKEILQIDEHWSHPRVRQDSAEFFWSPFETALTHVALVPHPGTVPAEMRFAGETCLEVSSTATGDNGIGGPFIFYPKKNDGEAQWYGRLEAGKTYRYEVWACEEGMDSPEITLTFGIMYGSIAQSFAVDGNWKLYGFTFTAPPEPTASNLYHDHPVITWHGKGKFWIDNIRLFRCDTPEQASQLFVPSPWVQEELFKSQPATGRKGMMRSMGVLLNAAPMKTLLSPYRDNSVIMDWYQSVGSSSNITLPFFLDYALRTGDSPATRMRPWLNVSSFSTEEEWAMLMEFLAAPIDPANPADVAAKPWAYLRYQERGVATPWTDEFECIYFEFANETWHNGMVSDEWIGWAKSGWVHGGAKQFGLAATHVLSYLTAHSSAFASAHAAGKLRVVMGSNYSDYAETAIVGTPLADAIGHTTYVGPRWEVGEEPATAFDDHGVQATLLGYLTDTEPYLDAYRISREKSDAAGRRYELLGYEGGPSGYSIYNMSAAQTEIVENYGKSQAMAVAALDAWLDSCQKGFSDQGYLCFGQGNGWTSHTPMADGYRPHVPWLAMTLRNRIASGSMIASNVEESPSLAWDGVAYPLVGSYAFRDGDTLTIFLLSRRLDGVHDGHDFGSGHTLVTLVLPADPVGNATLYKLAGNPRQSNRTSPDADDDTALRIATSEETLALSRESVIDLPPGAIYCLKVKTALSASALPPTRAGEPALAQSGAATTLSWDAVPGATGYRVLRSPVENFGPGVGVDELPVSGTSYTDTRAGGGTTFYYRVAAVNDWGTGLPSFHAVGGANAEAPLYAAPSVLSASAGDGCVYVKWSGVSGASGYHFGWSLSSGGPYTWIDCGVSTGSMLTGLADGMPVYYVVYATGAAGNGPQSAEQAVTPVGNGSLTAIASWEFADTESHVASVPVTSEPIAVDVTPFALGPGMISGNTDYHGFNGAVGFFPKDDANNFGTAGGGSLANALSRDLYVGFRMTPRAGYRVDLSLMRVPVVTYIDLSVTHLYMALRYKVADGDWKDAPSGPLAVTGENPWTPMNASFDLSTVAALQNVTGGVEFRLYFYSTDVYAQWCRVGIGCASGPDLVLSGTVEDATGGLSGWTNASFSSAEIAAGLAADDADPDSDGLSNLAEYALGTDPRHAGTSLPALSASADGRASLTLPLNASAHAAALYVETSEDLVHFTTLASSTGGLDFEVAQAGWTLEVAADGKSVTFRAADAAAKAVFFRVRAARL